MDKVAVITPIVLQTEEMLNIYLSNLETYNPVADTKVFIIFNRKTLPNHNLYNKFKQANSKLTYELINDFERSVAGAWNQGIINAIQDNRKIFHILAADIALHPNAMPMLYRLISTGKYDIISSIDFISSFGKVGLVENLCDFGSVILTEQTIQKYGWFDKEYKPAYFEDNDYTTRIIISGNNIYASYDAIHYHYGSATIKVDAEMAHHVQYWFGINQQRYKEKWGNPVTNDIQYMRSFFYKTPYNSGNFLSWWPEQEKFGYSISGGIHE